MNANPTIKQVKLLLGAGAALCALINSTAIGTPGIIDSAVNPANNHVYYLLANSNWTDAQSAAVGIGGNLTTVNNLAENNWIWNRWGTNRDLWIGLNDPVLGDGTGAQHAANFVWADGDTSAFRNWRSGEPNGDDYGYILAKGLVAGGGEWNDVSNIIKNGSEPAFYGVVEVVPEPAPGLLLSGGLLTALCANKLGGFRRKTS